MLPFDIFLFRMKHRNNRSEKDEFHFLIFSNYRVIIFVMVSCETTCMHIATIFWFARVASLSLITRKLISQGIQATLRLVCKGIREKHYELNCTYSGERNNPVIHGHNKRMTKKIFVVVNAHH